MSKEVPELWSCDEDGQCIPELDDVITDRISEGDIENGSVITVYGFDKEIITDKDKSRIVDRLLEILYEELAEDYEHPDYEGSSNEPDQEVKDKAFELVEKISSKYKVTICRTVAEKKIKIIDVENCTWEEIEVEVKG